MLGNPIPTIIPPGMGLSSLTAQKGTNPAMPTPNAPRRPRTAPLPPAYTCPVCSGLKSSLDMNCLPCSSWASRIFTRLGPSGTVLVYHPTRTWTMES